MFFPGIHTCFVCKKRSEDVRRCMIPVCGKFYHGECIANFAPTVAVNRGFRCSIHVCLTCFIANPNSSTISKGEAGRTHARTSAFCDSSILTLTARLPLGRLVRCVRCPIAYHATDLCMAAGCVILSNNSIICPNHFIPRRGVKNHEHVNVSWCFVCTEGGVQIHAPRNQQTLQHNIQSNVLLISSSGLNFFVYSDCEDSANSECFG